MTSSGGANNSGSDETARKAGETKPPAPRPADGVARPAFRRRPGDKPFIPFVRFEDVVVRCGHVEKFGLLPDGKDRFREARRQKVISRDCKACREGKQRAAEAAAQLRQIAKEKRAEQQPTPTKKTPRPQSGRLPD